MINENMATQVMSPMLRHSVMAAIGAGTAIGIGVVGGALVDHKRENGAGNLFSGYGSIPFAAEIGVILPVVSALYIPAFRTTLSEGQLHFLQNIYPLAGGTLVGTMVAAGMFPHEDVPKAKPSVAEVDGDELQGILTGRRSIVAYGSALLLGPALTSLAVPQFRRALTAQDLGILKVATPVLGAVLVGSLVAPMFMHHDD